MKYELRRRLYSQNFLRNPKLVEKLIRLSTIGNKDTVLEIGPGRGILTQELIKFAGCVIAVELDYKLSLSLFKKFKNVENLELINSSFLSLKLPTYPFKVFANIPFIITADVIKKLTSDNNFQEGYLVVQKEAAKKFIGKPYDYKNSMMATLLKPWFEISIFWKFERCDFIPRPNVDCVMIKLKRRELSLVPVEQKQIFRDYIFYIYNREKVAKQNFVQLIKLFERYVQNTTGRQKRLIALEARKILEQQQTTQKIHRTRTDKNWRRY
jgi:23S rRNA (adenine-N6)-dimethyltransferase